MRLQLTMHSLPFNKPIKRVHHAFTLIELLVVVAIIALLAGILFPVFAQAKFAALRTGSLSNLKQITLGSLMYASDADDGLPIYASGNAQYVGVENSSVLTWVGQTQPYVKSLRVLVDPVMGDPHGIFGSGAEAKPWNQNAYPDYGINYTFLSPWVKDSSGNCTLSQSISASNGAHPSSTILFTTTYFPNEDGQGRPTGGYSDYGDWAVTAPGALSLFKGSANYCVWGDMDWSAHPGSFNNDKPFTAEASQRYSGGTVNSMLDGHAKYLNADQETAGTDYATSTYTHTRITEPAKYLWSYDELITN